jgi:hypothetical protein
MQWKSHAKHRTKVVLLRQLKVQRDSVNVPGLKDQSVTSAVDCKEQPGEVKAASRSLN